MPQTRVHDSSQFRLTVFIYSWHIVKHWEWPCSCGRVVGGGANPPVHIATAGLLLLVVQFSYLCIGVHGASTAGDPKH